MSNSLLVCFLIWSLPSVTERYLALLKRLLLPFFTGTRRDGQGRSVAPHSMKPESVGKEPVRCFSRPRKSVRERGMKPLDQMPKQPVRRSPSSPCLTGKETSPVVKSVRIDPFGSPGTQNVVTDFTQVFSLTSKGLSTESFVRVLIASHPI